MPKEDKKDWDDFGMDESETMYAHIIKIIQSLNSFSTWLITIGLATLAFFITVLFQIKKEPILPNKYLALIAILSLVLSLGLGFYFRFKFEAREILFNFQRALWNFSDMLKSTTKYEATAEERKLFTAGVKALSVLDDKITEVKDSLLSKKYLFPLSIQGITLFLGIILSSSYMLWYIFVI